MQEKSELTNQIIDAITDKKGKKISIVELSGFETAPASKFIICQGGSTSQVSAIADSIRDKVQKTNNVKPYNYDGYKNSQWIVIDYGEILVHVFLPEYRQFYNLEELWNDAPITNIEEID